MLTSRVSNCLRHVSSRTQLMGQRQMAIASTVKKASDTSGKEFPAPSHVSLSSQASEMAQQLSTFYSNPDSVIKLPEDARQNLESDILKKMQAIPDIDMSEHGDEYPQVPSEIRLGDNPLFDTFKAKRGKKLVK